MDRATLEAARATSYQRSISGRNPSPLAREAVEEAKAKTGGRKGASEGQTPYRVSRLGNQRVLR